MQAGGAGQRHHVDAVVGTAAGGEQGHQPVDQRALVDHRTQGAIGRGARDHGADAAGRLLGEGAAQLAVRVHEGGARQHQTHGLEHQLVGVGGAVEGAGARRVVGAALHLQQGVTAHFAGGVLLAHLHLLVIADAARHRAGWHEGGGQVGVGERPHDLARRYFVADAEQQGGVEGVVGERQRGRLGDQVAGEQGHVHPRLPLGHAVAHGGHTAGHLGAVAQLGQRGLDDVRIALIGLMGAQHVVVGGDDAHVGAGHVEDAPLLVTAGGGHGVGQVAAGQCGAGLALIGLTLDAGQKSLAAGGTALANAGGDAGNDLMDHWACSNAVTARSTTCSKVPSISMWNTPASPSGRSRVSN